MVARGEMSPKAASRALGVIVQVARENAKDVDPRGLRMRLVWTAADARKDEARALVRQAKQQEQQLANVAEKAIRAGLPAHEVAAMVAREAGNMTPVPPTEMGDAAMRLARWRVKNG